MMRQNSGRHRVAVKPQKSFLGGFTLVVVVLLGLLILSSCGGGGGGVPSITDEQRIIDADTQFRRSVVRALEGSAREFGVNVNTSNFAAGIIQSSDGGYDVIINSVIRDAEKLTMDELRRGANVMFTFVQFSDGRKGFFVTHIRQREDGKWVADLRTLDRRVVVEDVYVDESGLLKPVLTFSWRGRRFCIDYWILELCIGPEPEIDWSPRTQGGYEDQITNSAKEMFDTISKVLNKYVNGTDGDIYISRDDVLIVARIHPGVHSWTIEQLSRNPVLTIMDYRRIFAVGKYSSIKKVQLLPQGDIWTSPDLPGATAKISSVVIGTELGNPNMSLEKSDALIIFPIKEHTVELKIPIEE